MVSTRNSLRCCLIAFILLVATKTTRPQDLYNQEGLVAFTAPSKDVTLAFLPPGLIEKVNVKEGDAVTSGQLLAQLDDSVALAHLALLEDQSRDTTQIEARQAELEQRKVDLKRLEEGAAKQVVTKFELDHARLGVKIAEWSLRSAQSQHKQSKLRYEEEKLRVEQMRLKSPITGRVEKVHFQPGESVEALAGVIRVVAIDPSWVDIDVPLTRAKNLRARQIAKARFTDGLSVEGKVVFVANIANAAAGTLTVRVEMPNAAGRPAGERVQVTFSDSVKPKKTTGAIERTKSAPN